MQPALLPRLGAATVVLIVGWAALSYHAGAAEKAPADTTAADTASAFPPGDAKQGKKLFTAKGCVACHKADGSGGFKVSGNPTPDWRDPKRMSDPRYDDAYLRDCIVNGKPESGMVPWKGNLKPEQVEDLIAYIHTFEKKKK